MQVTLNCVGASPCSRTVFDAHDIRAQGRAPTGQNHV
jgi:hypothetical protein